MENRNAHEQIEQNISDESLLRFFKNHYHWLILVLLYSFLIFSPFLGEHWVHDSYCVTQFGYGYMNGLYSQGRLISHLFYKILKFINPPYALAMFVSVSASLIFLSLASFLVLYLVAQYNPLTMKNKRICLIAFLGSISTFFNLFILDSFLFFENAIMSLGVLLAVVSVYHFLKAKNIFNYFCCLFCLVCSVFCYQADIAYFLPLVIVFLASSYRKLKPVIARGLLAGILYAGAIMSNYIFVKLISSSDKRVSGEVDIFTNIDYCISAVSRFFNNTFSFLPDHLFSFFCFVLIAFLVYFMHKSKNYMALILSILSFVTLIICALLPNVVLSTSSWYVMPRSTVALAAINGLIILAVSLNSLQVNKLLVIICTIFTLLISQAQIDIQKNSYANNKLDDQEIRYIANSILNYEEDNSLIISDIYISSDTQSKSFRESLNNYNDLTIRVLSASWMVNPMLNRYLDRNYPELFMSELDYDRLFKDKNWDEFSDKQLVFEDDKLYICIY